MGHTLQLALTDELRAYVDAHCGDGTMFATPDEFIRDLLRQRKRQEDAERARDAILAGYNDALAGRSVEYEGDLRETLKKAGDISRRRAYSVSSDGS